MLKKLDAKNMFVSDLGWLQSRFHFSFAEYRNLDNMNFGVLRVLNDDIIQAKQGFGKHPHKNMEIISYVVDGELTHQDSMGNKEILNAGDVQYLSAGTGITHSEMNDSDKKSRLLQIWIVPPKNSTEPIYGSQKYKKEESSNRLLNIVSSQSGDAQIKIHQDVNIFVSKLEKDKTISVDIKENRQIYFVQIEGTSTINEVELNHADAMEITKESKIDINAISDSHFLFIEMKES
ncbi:MAG: pirin family protein [Arcobacteraceae bacterium]